MSEFKQKWAGHVAHGLTAGAAIKGGQALKISKDNTVVTATAGSTFIGVAGHDAEAGQMVTVLYGAIGELACAGNVAAGDVVKTGADGKAVKATNRAEAGAFGIALTAGTDSKPALIRTGV